MTEWIQLWLMLKEEPAKNRFWIPHMHLSISFFLIQAPGYFEQFQYELEIASTTSYS